MAITTDIEWPDSTLNIQMGCDGCELWNPKANVKRCYAGILHERYAGKSKGYPPSFDQPQIFLRRLVEAQRWPDLTGKPRPDKPWLNGLPRGIFLDDMGDTFTKSLPDEWLAEPDSILGNRSALDVLAELPAIIMLLTKRPDRQRRFFLNHRTPDNFILMTSITSRATMNRLKQLLRTPARWHGISFEPVWGSIELELGDKRCGHSHLLPEGAGLLRCQSCDGLFRSNSAAAQDETGARALGPREIRPALSWVIAGGESGPKRKPVNLDDIRKVRDDCARAGVPFFMKQVDKVQPIPPDLNIRQMPAFTLAPLAAEVHA